MGHEMHTVGFLNRLSQQEPTWTKEDVNHVRKVVESLPESEVDAITQLSMANADFPRPLRDMVAAQVFVRRVGLDAASASCNSLAEAIKQVVDKSWDASRTIESVENPLGAHHKYPGELDRVKNLDIRWLGDQTLSSIGPSVPEVTTLAKAAFKLAEYRNEAGSLGENKKLFLASVEGELSVVTGTFYIAGEIGIGHYATTPLKDLTQESLDRLVSALEKPPRSAALRETKPEDSAPIDVTQRDYLSQLKQESTRRKDATSKIVNGQVSSSLKGLTERFGKIGWIGQGNILVKDFFSQLAHKAREGGLPFNL